MGFLAILIALLIEQARPLSFDNPVHAGLRGWGRTVRRNLDAGDHSHGWVAWLLAVGVPAAVAAMVYHGLWRFSAFLAFGWTVAVLYLTLGFRQFSHHFTSIRDALEDGQEDAARERLAHWQQVDVGLLPRSEIVRHVIEYSVISAHRHVFGVLAWFSILAAVGLGPTGAVLYRMAEFVSRYWHHRQPVAQHASEALQRASAQAWWLIDWLPARLTALSFAVVGSFEEAIEGWRFHAQRFPNDNDGVVLAATAGAINVRLGGEALKARSEPSALQQGLEIDADLGDSDSTPGVAPEVGHLRSVVGLVWRSVVVWMLLLALLTLARLLG